MTAKFLPPPEFQGEFPWKMLDILVVQNDKLPSLHRVVPADGGSIRIPDITPGKYILWSLVDDLSLHIRKEIPFNVDDANSDEPIDLGELQLEIEK